MNIRGMISSLFLVALLAGTTIWFVHNSDNQRRPLTGKVVFEPLPTPKLDEMQRMIYEQLKKEAAEVETNKLAKKGKKPS